MLIELHFPVRCSAGKKGNTSIPFEKAWEGVLSQSSAEKGRREEGRGVELVT
jgi:hypothetical protein